MKFEQYSSGMKRFLRGFGIFLFAASTVILVTDPYKMADMALVILVMYMMVSGLTKRQPG